MKLTIPNLVPGAKYAIQVRAVVSGRNSEWSNMVEVDIPVPFIPALAPLNVTNVVVSDSFVIEWDAVTANTLGGLVANPTYEIEITSGTDQRNVHSTQISGSRGKYTLTFDENKAIFGSARPVLSIRVRAVDATGFGGLWSEAKSASNPPPGTPTTPVATGASDSIMISWGLPATENSDIERYDVHAGATAGFTPTNANKIYSGASTSATYVTTNYGPQHFKIFAVDKFGQTSAVAASTSATATSPFEMDTTPPGNATGLTVAVTNATDGSSATANVSWTAPGGTDLKEYVLYYREKGALNWSTVVTDAVSVAVNLPKAYTVYEFFVKTQDWANNKSSGTAVVEGGSATLAAPTAPGTISAIRSRDNLRLSWASLAAANIVGYSIQIDTVNTFANSSAQYVGNTTVFTAGGLSAGTTYFVRLRGRDAKGQEGTWSVVQSFSTLGELTPGDIGAPTNSDFTNLDNLVDGIIPKVDDSIKSYEVQYAVNSSETVAPTTGWSPATPTRTPGTFIWTRTVVTKQDNTTATTNPALLTGNSGSTGPQGPQGTPAPVITLSAPTQVLMTDSVGAGAPSTPASTVVTGTATGTTITTYEYSLNGGAFTTTPPSGVVRSGNDVTVTGNGSGGLSYSAKTLAIRMSDNAGISDTMTIAKVWDGVDAISIVMSNESHTFVGDTTSALPATAQGLFIGYKGAQVVPINVLAWGTPPTGMTITTQNNNTTSAGYTITVTSALTELSGSIIAWLLIDNKFIAKTFTYSVSLMGATGVKGDDGTPGRSVVSVTPCYRAVATGAAAPAKPTTATHTGWAATEPAWVANTELYRTEKVTYTTAPLFEYTDVSKVSSYAAAVSAMDAANGKNKLMFSAAAPTASTPGRPGDMYWVRSGNNITEQWLNTAGTDTTSGNVWAKQELTNTTIANLDAGKISTGTIDTAALTLASSGVIQSANYDAAPNGFRLTATGMQIKGAPLTISNVSGLGTELAGKATPADIEAAKSTNYGYRYKANITIGGDHDKYYPVVISGGNQSVKRDLLVVRSYAELHPPEWNSPTHGGGLTLKLKWNFGGWGGAAYSWEVHEREELYNPTVGGAQAGAIFGMTGIVYLRGGGAVYHLYSDQPLAEGNGNLVLNDGSLTPVSWPFVATTPTTLTYKTNTSYTWVIPSPLTSVDEISIGQRQFIKLTQNWTATGTTEINGGAIKADTIDVIKLKANSTFTQTLNVASTFTVGTPTQNGIIQSYGYVANSTGWRLDKTTGLEINNGKVKASTLIGDTLTSSTGKIQIGLGASIVTNGGAIRSAAYGSDAYNSNATAGFFLDNANIHIPDGNISAKAIKSGTIDAQTITLANNGKIVGGTSGFELSSTGLTIPDGGIQAKSLAIGRGTNVLPAELSTLISDPSDKTYLMNSSTAAIMATTVTAGVDGRVSPKVYSFKPTAGWLAVGSSQTFNLFTSALKVNTPVEPGGRYLFSFYVWLTGSTPANHKIATTASYYNGSTWVAMTTVADTALNNTNGAATAATAQRRAYYVDIPAGLTRIGLSIGLSAPAGSTAWPAAANAVVEGLMFEAAGPNANPSPWALGAGSTTIDGGRITTGEMASSIPGTMKIGLRSVSGGLIDGSTIANEPAGVPAWSLNMAGQAQVGGLSVRGNVVLGAPAAVVKNISLTNATTSGTTITLAGGATNIFYQGDVGATVTGTGLAGDTKIASITSTKVAVLDKTPTTALANVTVTIARPYEAFSSVSSANYIRGTQGWSINSDGYAEFRNLAIDSIDGGSVKTGTLSVSKLIASELTIGSVVGLQDSLNSKETPAQAQAKASAALEAAKMYSSKVNNFSRTETTTGWHSFESLVSVNHNGTNIKALRRQSSSNEPLATSDWFDVDPSKAYMITAWVRSDHPVTPGPGARVYMGLTMDGIEGNSIQTIDAYTGAESGSPTPNFYFHYPPHTSMTHGQWYQWTGYVFPYTATVQDMRGLGNVSLNAKLRPGSKRMHLRFLNYYNNGIQTTAYVANPSVVEVSLDTLRAASRVVDWTYTGQTTINGGAIQADTITAGQVAADAISAKHTITGATIQTTATPNRGVKINTSGVWAFNASGENTFGIDSATGSAFFKGAINSGSTISGSTINGGVINGAEMIVGDTADDWLRLAHSGGISTIHFWNASSLVGGLNTWLYYDTLAGTNKRAMQLSATESVFIYRAGGGGSAGIHVGAHGNKVQLTSTQMVELNPGNGLVYAPGLAATTDPGNVRVSSNGRLLNGSNSSRALKAAIEPINQNSLENLLNIDVVTWFDIANAERMASAIENGDDELFDVEPMRRIPGIVAEDVHDSGAVEFVEYGEDNEVKGIKYERVGVAWIPLVRQQRERIEALEAQVAALLERFPES